MDYFGARYYSNGLGRFITPDWAAKAADVPYADFADPQSLNLYTYVRNIPTSQVDVDGHHCPTCPVEEPTAADWELIDEAGAGAGISFGAILTGAAAVLVPASVFAPSVGQSNADERAAMQQAQQEREQQNGGVDPQQTPEPATAAAGGNKKGGGRNAQKQNRNRSASAQDKYNQAKADYERANKMPPGQARKEAMDKAQKDMKHWQKKAADKSETHSRKAKGRQQ